MNTKSFKEYKLFKEQIKALKYVLASFFSHMLNFFRIILINGV